jgi:hypothetical protein
MFVSVGMGSWNGITSGGEKDFVRVEEPDLGACSGHWEKGRAGLE